MKNINAVMIASIFILAVLALPVSAYADWANPGMHPMVGANLSPQWGQHETHAPVAQPVHIQPQRVQPSRLQPRPVSHEQPVQRHEDKRPDYFRHDTHYYGYEPVNIVIADVNPPFAVPDGFETIEVDGQTYYYNDGIFYQQVGNQLDVIPAVLGAVVDSIPQDYQIVMADGAHYLVTGGIYYQRVEQGFQVVQSPGPSQE